MGSITRSRCSCGILSYDFILGRLPLLRGAEPLNRTMRRSGA